MSNWSIQILKAIVGQNLCRLLEAFFLSRNHTGFNRRSSSVEKEFVWLKQLFVKNRNMATFTPDIMFPYLRDYTKLIQHEDVLYKVKITYDQKSFKGRKLTFTRKELSYDIEQFLKAVLYMCEKRIKLKPIHSDNLIVLPSVRRWIFPTKYPNYGFKRNGKILNTSDVMIQLNVMHIDDATVKEDTNVPDSDQLETEAINQHPLEKQILLSRTDHRQQEDAQGSRFVRDRNGGLIRYVTLPTQNVSVSMKNSKRDKTKRIDFKSQINQREVQEESLKTENHEDNDNSLNIESAKDKLSSLEGTKHNERSHRKKSSSGNAKDVFSNNKSQGTCMDCLEEHQYRRRSSRLKAKCTIDYTDSLQHKGTVIHDKNNSCLDQPTCTDNSMKFDMDSKTVEQADTLETKKSPRKAYKRNAGEWWSNSKKLEDDETGMKRRRRDPVPVYQDILQNRNKDRHLLEQLEREETKKLGELYGGTVLRRSARTAEKSYEKASGKLSGLWSKIMGQFFTPKK